MSKGHGKWEHAILGALKEAPAFYLTDLLPLSHTRSQIVALNRAARNLADAGKVNMKAWLFRSLWEYEQPHGFVAIYRVGDPAPERHQITRLKRCTDNPTEPMQHLTSSGRRERGRRARGPIIEADYSETKADILSE